MNNFFRLILLFWLLIFSSNIIFFWPSGKYISVKESWLFILKQSEYFLLIQIELSFCWTIPDFSSENISLSEIQWLSSFCSLSSSELLKMCLLSSSSSFSFSFWKFELIDEVNFCISLGAISEYTEWISSFCSSKLMPGDKNINIIIFILVIFYILSGIIEWKIVCYNFCCYSFYFIIE